MISFTESELEAAPLEWLSGLGWAVAHGSEIGPDAQALSQPRRRGRAGDRGTDPARLRPARHEPARRDAGTVGGQTRLLSRWRPNDSAVRVLGDETLRDIARELVGTVRGNVAIDWTLRENVRAHLRRLVKRVLRKCGYPPDKQDRATLTVLEQAEALSSGWAA